MNYLALGIAVAIAAVLYLIIEVIVRMSGKRSKLPTKMAMEAAGHLYESKVLKTILMRNNEGIEDVQKLESLKSLYYYPDQYPVITKMIREAKDADTIRNFSIDNPQCDEDIDIMTFVDQLDRRWVAVIYGSNELWQDPEAIDILPAGF